MFIALKVRMTHYYLEFDGSAGSGRRSRALVAQTACQAKVSWLQTSKAPVSVNTIIRSAGRTAAYIPTALSVKERANVYTGRVNRVTFPYRG